MVLADQLERRKFEMPRETLVQQMQHQRQRGERDQNGKQGWTKKDMSYRPEKMFPPRKPR